jgi:hypothetical protein
MSVFMTFFRRKGAFVVPFLSEFQKNVINSQMKLRAPLTESCKSCRMLQPSTHSGVVGQLGEVRLTLALSSSH